MVVVVVVSRSVTGNSGDVFWRNWLTRDRVKTIEICEVYVTNTIGAFEIYLLPFVMLNVVSSC